MYPSLLLIILPMRTPFFAPLVVGSAAATSSPIGLDRPGVRLGAPGLTRVNLKGEEKRVDEEGGLMIFECHYDVMVRLDTIPGVNVDWLVPGLQCLDESPAIRGVSERYSATETLLPVDRDSIERAHSHVLQCTHGEGVVDRYYFTPRRESHLGKAMLSPSKEGGELAKLIQTMCLNLRAFKVRVPGLIRAATRGDAERAEDINKAVAAFALRAEGLGIVQSNSAQVRNGLLYTEVSDEALGCALRIYHKGNGKRFSLFIESAIKRSFGGAGITPRSRKVAYRHVAKLRVNRTNPRFGELTCQTHAPSY